MAIAPITLSGKYVRLEPLEQRHAAVLVAATGGQHDLYARTFVPFDMQAAESYIQAALDLRSAGTGIAFATVRLSDETVVGSTRFWELIRWPWPADSPFNSGQVFDSGEIGYTWLGPSAMRTAINTEQKLLMLKHAFEDWRCLSVHFHTDERNEQSAAALQRIGARLEGTLRAHRIAADITPRNSLRFSIVQAEWPGVKSGLERRLAEATEG
jgi:RimJ/RimL family protein N-acetyltransferase